MADPTVQAPTRVDALGLPRSLRSLGCEARTGRNPLAEDRRTLLIAPAEPKELLEALELVGRWCPVSAIRMAN
jgi:hypothetical protein